MVLTLEDLCRFFQEAGKEPNENVRKRKQHTLVANYLLQNLGDRHKRRVLAVFLTSHGSKTEADVKADLLRYTRRERRDIGWIRMALDDLEHLGLILRQDSAPSAFTLKSDASCLKQWWEQWWEDREWEKDDVLGIKEWLEPTGLLVSP